MVTLYPHQLDAIERLKTGSVLNGRVGSGKSLTALAYYLRKTTCPPLYIITTARKRDSLEWDKECKAIELNHTYTVDSWNNISKYSKVKDAFFIFDEQRVVGQGLWAKTFIKIAKHNDWIMLSATPGDNWLDYIPLFIANGFFRSRGDFLSKHAIFARFSKYPRIDRFIGEDILESYRRDILVDSNFESDLQKAHERKHVYIKTPYDKSLMQIVVKERKDPYTMEPIENSARVYYLMRKVANSDMSRCSALRKIMKWHKHVIIFYSFNYELSLIRDTLSDIPTAEWNGFKHEKIPTGDSWAYIVQYKAGAEGWNCIQTNTIIFFSQTDSYKELTQAAGRIDRLNSPFDSLYFYHLISYAPIDQAIKTALDRKEDFNFRAFLESTS